MKLLTYDDVMLQEINDNVNLLEYVEQFIELKQRGKEYFGKCFKHIDLTPSFSLNPEKNLYYCHSCGIGGGIIGFLMEYEGLLFDDAVIKASILANIDLSTMCQSQTVKFLRKNKKTVATDDLLVHEILDKSILNNYKKCDITEWIEEGIPQDILDLYEVMIDEKSNRIVYPVYNMNGDLINIKGRTRFVEYKRMKLQKYINYFKVGTVDYFQGLNISLNDVIDCGEIIIFESIKSVMKLRKFGKKNSASAEKHTLTDIQIKILITLRVDVVLAYDSDVSLIDILDDVKKLKQFTNVYVIDDKNKLLGGKEAKNSPIDCGYEIFQELYEEKIKVI